MSVPMSNTFTLGKFCASILAPIAERKPPAQCTTMGLSVGMLSVNSRSLGSGMLMEFSNVFPSATSLSCRTSKMVN